MGPTLRSWLLLSTFVAAVLGGAQYWFSVIDQSAPISQKTFVDPGKPDTSRTTALQTTDVANFNALRWLHALQTPPLMINELVALRDRNFAKLDQLGRNNNITPLKVVYDLGCSMSAWRILWIDYTSIKKYKTVDQKYSTLFDRVRLQIFDDLDLMSIILTNDQRDLFSLKNDDPRTFVHLSPNIEHQLDLKHDLIYSAVYAFAYSVVATITVLRKPELFDSQWQQNLPLPILLKIADNFNAPEHLKDRITNLETRNASPELANDVIVAADDLFDVLIPKVPESASDAISSRTISR